MPTKYDVFAEILEKAPCKPKDLNFKVPVYMHIESLLKLGWIKKSDKGILIPRVNKKSKEVFEIIRWSLKNNFNPNIWFSESIRKILEIIPKEIPKINPKEISGNASNKKIIDFLVNDQFILLYKKTPKLGVLLNHKIFSFLQDYYEKKIEIKEKYLDFEEIKDLVQNTKKREINPFDLELFEFLAGSVQLEGGTVTIGETVDLLTRDIYPDKPQKDIQMVKNLNEGFRFIQNHLEEDLTIENLKEINKICLFSLHQGAGRLKKTNNKIVGNPDFKTVRPEQVVPELINFCSKFNSIKTRGEALGELGFIHNELQRIHPFSDGNSRTTRLILNWLLMRYRFPILVLKKGSFDRYMSLTKLSKKRDDSELRRFLLHVIYHEDLIEN